MTSRARGYLSLLPVLLVGVVLVGCGASADQQRINEAEEKKESVKESKTLKAEVVHLPDGRKVTCVFGRYYNTSFAVAPDCDWDSASQP